MAAAKALSGLEEGLSSAAAICACMAAIHGPRDTTKSVRRIAALSVSIARREAATQRECEYGSASDPEREFMSIVCAEVLDVKHTRAARQQTPDRILPMIPISVHRRS